MMKVISVAATMILLLFVLNGDEMMTVGQAECQKALYGGGGCVDAPCDKGCKDKFGAKSYGLCFFYRQPADTCVCRYPC